MNSPAPKLSIITVCYNAGDVIVATLESIKNQTENDFEYIVVDGNSCDDTIEKVKAANIIPVNIISEPDTGIYNAMNKGLKVAKGDYVLFLNAGDSFYDENVIARFLSKVKEHSDADVIYGQTDIVDKKRNRIGSRHLHAPEELNYKSFADGMLVCHQAFFAKRELASPYNEKYRFSSDFDWCINILKKSKNNIYLGKIPVVNYLCEGITTKNHSKSLIERFNIMINNYGLWTTIAKHIKFIFRNLKKKPNGI